MECCSRRSRSRRRAMAAGRHIALPEAMLRSSILRRGAAPALSRAARSRRLAAPRPAGRRDRRTIRAAMADAPAGVDCRSSVRLSRSRRSHCASRGSNRCPHAHALPSLCARNARIRMTIPEAYAAHRSVIAWHETTSEDRLPGRVARRRPDTAGDDAQRDGQLAAARSPESLDRNPPAAPRARFPAGRSLQRTDGARRRPGACNAGRTDRRRPGDPARVAARDYARPADAAAVHAPGVRALCPLAPRIHPQFPRQAEAAAIACIDRHRDSGRGRSERRMARADRACAARARALAATAAGDARRAPPAGGAPRPIPR